MSEEEKQAYDKIVAPVQVRRALKDSDGEADEGDGPPVGTVDAAVHGALVRQTCLFHSRGCMSLHTRVSCMRRSATGWTV